MKTLVIIPTYNERENILPVVNVLLANSTRDANVLIVDDHSPDGTGVAADQLAATHPHRVFVQHREDKQGLGSAYLAGFKYGIDNGYELICEMDADASHDPTDMQRLTAAAEEGADVVIGSRRVPGGKVEGWGAHRHLMSNGAMAVARAVLGLKTRDVTSGFRCYTADAVRHLLSKKIEGSGYAFQEETLFYAERAGFRVKEVPITFRDRTRGTSKLSWRDVVQFFVVIVKLRLQPREEASPRQ